MKPNDARRLHKQRERASLVHSEMLLASLTDAPEVPAPHLVPDDVDRAHTLREYRRLSRLAAGERGAKRLWLLDRAIVELVRLIWIERVLSLDPLDRAALTPARLVTLSAVDPEEIKRRFDALQDGSETG